MNRVTFPTEAQSLMVMDMAIRDQGTTMEVATRVVVMVGEIEGTTTTKEMVTTGIRTSI